MENQNNNPERNLPPNVPAINDTSKAATVIGQENAAGGQAQTSGNKTINNQSASSIDKVLAALTCQYFQSQDPQDEAEESDDIKAMYKVLSICANYELPVIFGKSEVTAKLYRLEITKSLLLAAKTENCNLACWHNGNYIYTGKNWHLLNREAIEPFLVEAAREMGVPDFFGKEAEFIKKLVDQFTLTAAINPNKKRNSKKICVNLKNGTLELLLRDNKITIRPHNPLDLMTYTLNTTYDDKAKAPMFLAFLDQVLPDEDSRKNLQEYMGSIFIPRDHLKLEKALMLFGKGANGKSVIFDIIYALLGSENVGTASLEALTDSKGYSRGKLAGQLVNYCTEIDKNQSSAMFKRLVSNEPIETRSPYEKPITITNYAKLIFNCNSLPKEVEQSDGYYRRFLILPMTVTISEKDQDKQLANKIIEGELPGVFNWIIDGMVRLLEQKNFTECKAAVDAVSLYREESDSVLYFLTHFSYTPSVSVTKPQNDLYKLYSAYCKTAGVMPTGLPSFGKRLTDQGYTRVRRNIGLVVYINTDPTGFQQLQKFIEPAKDTNIF